MSLFKALIIIVIIWLIIKIKTFLSGISITSKQSVRDKKNKDGRSVLDIQDADYEDVE